MLYFETSVNGLRVGAPVKFKGVEIGSVKNIVLPLEKDTQVARIPVIIEIDREKLAARGAAGTIADPEAFRKAIIPSAPRAAPHGEPGYGIAIRRPRFFSRDSGKSRFSKPTAVTNIRKSQPHPLPLNKPRMRSLALLTNSNKSI